MDGGMAGALGAFLAGLIAAALGTLLYVLGGRAERRRAAAPVRTPGMVEVERAVRDLAAGRSAVAPDVVADDPAAVLAALVRELGHRLDDEREAAARPEGRRSAALAEALDALTDKGLVLADADLTILEGTESAGRLLGVPRAGLPGRALQDLLAPPGFRELAAQIVEHRRDRTSFAVWVVLTGGVRAIVRVAWPAATPDAVALLVEPAFEDPADAAAAAAQRYHAILDGLADGVLVVRDGAVVEANPQARRWLGDALVGARLRDLVAAEDLFLLVDRTARAEAGVAVDPVTCRLVTPGMPGRGGREREFEAFITTVPLEGRRAAAITLRDLGGERRADRRAQIHEARLQSIIDAVADGLVLLVPPVVDGSPWRVGLVNGKLLDVLGVTGGATHGIPEEEFRALVAHRFREPAQFATLLEAAVRDPLREHVGACDLNDGTGTLEFVVRPVLDGEGTLIGRLVVAHDITRHRQSEARLVADAAAIGRSREALQRAYEELSVVNRDLERKTLELDRLNAELVGLDRARAQLLADVSHELQTPLVSIRGYTQMVLEGRLGKINDEQRRGLEVALRNVDRMVELINNLLALARSERRSPADPEPVDPAAIARDVLERQQDTARARGITLEVRATEPAPAVAAERDALVQVVENLVANGIKFNRPGGRVTVSIEAGPVGFVALQVHDTGIGIAPEERTQIFERFYRGRSAAGIPGSGIGLATVRNLVERHGGTIDVESAPGEGATFRVLWPRAAHAARPVS